MELGECNHSPCSCLVSLIGTSTPGKLYRSCMPRGYHDTANLVYELWKTASIDVVCALSPPSEFIEKSGEDQLLRYEELGYTVLPGGTEDRESWELETLQGLVDSVHSSLEDGLNVAVHCSAGRGRTGTVIACLLAKLNRWSAEHSLAHLRQNYSIGPESVVQSESLLAYVEQYC